MKWNYSARVIRHDAGEWITIARETEAGHRQEARVGEPLEEVIHHEDGIAFIPVTGRENIIIQWQAMAETYNQKGPGNMQWDNVEPVYGSPAWEAWDAGF